MNKISIVFCGPRYREYSINYAIESIANSFQMPEIIISTNDKSFALEMEKNPLVNKVILCENTGELPSLKFTSQYENYTNNNINKQRNCCLKGIEASSNELVLRLRTDQILLDDSILDLWNKTLNIPKDNNKRARIITSSIFSINPRYSERMPYHISDMLQFGYKEDLISYFSAPIYPFEYATWYERNKHHPSSNKFEKKFRSRYAVEQWLALHYIFNDEYKFPISFHNDWNEHIIAEFENNIVDYFVIAHPLDINLRASKFSSAESYYNTQCYSTHEYFTLLAKKEPSIEHLTKEYSPRGINKKYYIYLKPIIYSLPVQFIIGHLTPNIKNLIKQMLNKL